MLFYTHILAKCILDSARRSYNVIIYNVILGITFLSILRKFLEF